MYLYKSIWLSRKHGDVILLKKQTQDSSLTSTLLKIMQLVTSFGDQATFGV